MDIDRISSDSDGIIEGAPFHEVIQGDLVISYDPAGFTYPDGRGGVEQPAVGHARKLGTEEFEQVEDLLSGAHLSSAQAVHIGFFDPGDAGCVDPPHPGLHGLAPLHAAPLPAL